MPSHALLASVRVFVCELLARVGSRIPCASKHPLVLLCFLCMLLTVGNVVAMQPVAEPSALLVC